MGAWTAIPQCLLVASFFYLSEALMHQHPSCEHEREMRMIECILTGRSRGHASTAERAQQAYLLGAGVALGLDRVMLSFLDRLLGTSVLNAAVFRLLCCWAGFAPAVFPFSTLAIADFGQNRDYAGIR